MLDKLEEVLTHYIVCALWSSNDESTPEGGEPFDQNYGREDLAPETIESMRRDCKNFLQVAGPLLGQLPQFYGVSQDPYSQEAFVGHDFWLTRNGHGAGFWDRDLGDLGDLLTKLCKPFGECDLYLGDDGLIYI